MIPHYAATKTRIPSKEEVLPTGHLKLLHRKGLLEAQFSLPFDLEGARYLSP